MLYYFWFLVKNAESGGVVLRGVMISVFLKSWHRHWAYSGHQDWATISSSTVITVYALTYFKIDP